VASSTPLHGGTAGPSALITYSDSILRKATYLGAGQVLLGPPWLLLRTRIPFDIEPPNLTRL